MTNIAYADCPSGASGDMILAAFLNAGLPLDHLESELAKVDLGGYQLETASVMKQGLAAGRFLVKYEHQHHHRHYDHIRDMINDSGLAAPVKERALAVFDKLARAEGKIHGVEPERVHFHEVGAVDSIIDIVGFAIAWEYFGLSRLYASPLPLGSGWVDTAHGRLPLPAPATLALLDNVPTYGVPVEAELVTPTGAAILGTLVHEFGPRPPMTITTTGQGAGSMDLPDRPNILRLTLGRAANKASTGLLVENLLVAETNIDDMNPEIVPFLMDRLFEAGALDVWVTPIQMKKGRPAMTLSLLARPGDRDILLDIIMTESTSIGVRTYPTERLSLSREPKIIETPWGEVAVKAVHRGAGLEFVPEFESCRRIARKTKLPLKDIYLEVGRLAKNGA